MKHTLSVLVANQPGVLARVAGLFGRRGYNIESLAVGITENPQLSRMTIIVDGDDAVLEQVSKQLNKLIDTLKVTKLSPDCVQRELAMVQITATPAQRLEIMGIVDIFRAKVVDVGTTSMMLEITGEDGKIDAFFELLKPYGLQEVARTGLVALDRGALPQGQGSGK